MLIDLVGGIFDSQETPDANKIVKVVYGDLLSSMGLPKELHLKLLQDTHVALTELIHDYTNEGTIVGVELLDNGDINGTENPTRN